VELYLAGQGVEGIWSGLRQLLLCLLMQFLLGLCEARQVIIRAKLVQILQRLGWVEVEQVLQLLELLLEDLLPLEAVLDLIVQPFDLILLRFEQAREVLDNILIRVSWVLVAGIALGCHQLLQPALEVVYLLSLLGDLAVQRSDEGIFLNQLAHIVDLPLLNEQVLQLFDLAEETGRGTTTVLSDIGCEFVKLDPLGAGQALQLRVLLRQLIVICEKLPLLLAQLIDLGGKELGRLLLAIFLEV